MFNQSESLLIPHSNARRPSLSESFRSLFYILTPGETAYKDVSVVPNYTEAAVPSFFTLIALEFVISTIRGKRKLRTNDGVTSINAGITSRLIRLVSEKSLDMALYIYVYDEWRLADLPWDSSVTWLLSFVAMDFAYYWFHRAAHEINLFWMSHQTHHSSEDYNLTTALRQSSLQGFVSMFFYTPCALLVPPSVHLVHLQINILFQFWIHTELIDNLGPLEYILNTPSHHRVHHGRNPYCIDKNYAGTLIIWDRMFGTFAAERKDEALAYGLVHSINTFDPIYVQLGYTKYLCERVWQTEGFCNKMSVLFKGPGWSPGKPRLGDFKDLPEVENPIKKYHHRIPVWLSAYTVLHSITLIPVYDQLLRMRYQLAGHFILFDVVLLLCALTCVGYLFDKKPYAYFVECARCSFFGMLLFIFTCDMSTSHSLPQPLLYAISTVYISSAGLWALLLTIGGSKEKIT